MPDKETILKAVYSRLRRFVYPGVMLVLLSGLSSNTQGQEKAYAIHANIIYHFTKYINWPENKKTGDFMIGVVGNSPLYEELITNLANKTVGDQKIIIRKFSPGSVPSTCHILFIGEDESRNLKKIVSQTAGNSILIVTEEDGLIHLGSCINFIIVSDHLKLEINKTNIRQRGLDIASELLLLGKVVL